MALKVLTKEERWRGQLAYALLSFLYFMYVWSVYTRIPTASFMTMGVLSCGVLTMSLMLIFWTPVHLVYALDTDNL